MEPGPKREPLPKHRPRVVVIDGTISAGKTTLITEFADWATARGKTVAVVKEPVEVWVEGGHLSEFYRKIEDGAACYIFQTFAHVTRAIAFDEEYTRACKNGTDCLIVERWPTTDRDVFMENLKETVGEREMAKYHVWWDYWQRTVQADPDVFIYLRPSLDECMVRKTIRGRDGEEGVTLDYQESLQRLHDAMYKIEPSDAGLVSGREKSHVLEAHHADLKFHVAGSDQDTVFAHIYGWVFGDTPPVSGAPVREVSGGAGGR